MERPKYLPGSATGSARLGTSYLGQNHTTKDARYDCYESQFYGMT